MIIHVKVIILGDLMLKILLSLVLLPLITHGFDEDRFETLQVVPHVSGLRVDSITGEPGFIGYTEAWELIVQPDVEVTVLVFGYWLDKVEYVTFTDQVCPTSEFNISNSNFFVQTESRLEFKFTFPEWNTPWKLCVKQKGRYGELLLIDDDRTWIKSTAKRKEHYMPLPFQIIFITGLFSLSALFSGLNLGLMSLSTQELVLITKSGSEREAKYARAILPVRKRGNYLLCTILIMNVLVNASISILFEDLTSGAIAFVVSSLGIVFLGEITPQSICVKHGLAVGAKTLFLTKFFMWLTYPLSTPISKLLDFFLGEDVDQFDRNRLVEILKMTTENENKDLAADLKIAVGAMELSNKVAKDVMTKIDDVYMLSEDEVLDTMTIGEIVKRGYTRIPIFQNNDRNQVKSLLFVNDLALVDKKNKIRIKSVSQYHARELRIIEGTMSLSDLLEEFKKGNYHLAMVSEYREPQSPKVDYSVQHDSSSSSSRSLLSSTKEKGESGSMSQSTQLIGLITLEDIIEEILQSEIIDESDSVFDNVQRSRRDLNQCGIADLMFVETRSHVLSLNMLRVVVDWMRTYHTLFDIEHMETRPLEKVIQKNIKQANLISRVTDRTKRRINLYEAHVPSKRVILILEGEALVEFKETAMSFEVGPWTFFGHALLESISQGIREKKELTSNISFVPDFDLFVERRCRFLQVSVTSMLHVLQLSHFMKQARIPRPSISSLSFEENEPLTKAKTRDTNRPRNETTLCSFPGRRSVQEKRVRSASSVSAYLHKTSVPEKVGEETEL